MEQYGWDTQILQMRHAGWESIAMENSDAVFHLGVILCLRCIGNDRTSRMPLAVCTAACLCRTAGSGKGLVPPQSRRRACATRSWEANISALVPALHPSHFVSFGPVPELLKLWFAAETQWLCLSTYLTDRGLNTGNLVVSVKNMAPALMKLMSDRTERN